MNKPPRKWLRRSLLMLCTLITPIILFSFFRSFGMAVPTANNRIWTLAIDRSIFVAADITNFSGYGWSHWTEGPGFSLDSVTDNEFTSDPRVTRLWLAPRFYYASQPPYRQFSIPLWPLPLLLTSPWICNALVRIFKALAARRQQLLRIRKILASSIFYTPLLALVTLNLVVILSFLKCLDFHRWTYRASWGFIFDRGSMTFARITAGDRFSTVLFFETEPPGSDINRLKQLDDPANSAGADHYFRFTSYCRLYVTYDEFLVTIPLWLLLSIADVSFAFQLKRRLRKKAPGQSLCRTCQYDLRAHSPGDTCPEWGTPILIPQGPPKTHLGKPPLPGLSE